MTGDVTLWPLLDACDQCPATVTSSLRPSAAGDGAEAVVNVAHAATCSWFARIAALVGDAVTVSVPNGHGVLTHSRATP